MSYTRENTRYTCIRCERNFWVFQVDVALIEQLCPQCWWGLATDTGMSETSSPPNVNDMATDSPNANPGNDATLKEGQVTLPPSDDVQQ